MMPYFGWTIWTSGANSPGWFVPTSSTAAPSSFPIRSNVSGTPMSLLKLASLRIVGNFCSRMVPSTSLVVVFPFEPPIAITAKSKSFRYRAASAPKAIRTSLTSIVGHFAATGRSTTTALAPTNSGT